MEYLTPPYILDLVERVTPIALDPCAHPKAEATIRASQINVSDGLLLDWHATVQQHSNPHAGLVYVNPPYGRALAAWADKMAAERHCAIIALVPAHVDTRWWNTLDPIAWCALRGRIKFHDTAGNQSANAAPFPSAVCLLHAIYLTPRFVEVFSEHGPVYGRLK